MLGEFQIEEKLGEGGMGEVWNATHVASGTRVAIKVIHETRMRGHVSKRAFRREIHAVASLSHPGITRILDVGTVPSDHPRLGIGAPWFAMNLAEGGGFDIQWVENFNDLARLAFDILDALAYAHARGIVHRDIKPENILLSGTRKDGYRPVLTDFGLAFVVDPDELKVSVRETELKLTAGTPWYMAPEQFHGQWRSYGAWTDLYALGCVLWQVACGRVPFSARSVLATAMLHFSEPFPALAPRFSVPNGFGAWLRRLSAKSIHDRFQCAADASWSLYGIIGRNPTWQPSAALRAEDEASSENVFRPTLTMSGETLQLSTDSLGEILRGDRISDTEALPVVKPPVPGLVSESGESVSEALKGVGLNLFGLRRVPLVDRKPERDKLWNTFKKSTRADARVVMIKGATGVGKSRLAEWLTTRAAELGAAYPIIVRHNPSASGAHGLGHAIRVVMRAVNLEGEPLLTHIEHFLLRHLDDDVERRDRANEIHQLLTGSPVPGNPRVIFESPEQRYMLVSWLFRKLALDRPLICLIENASWASDTLTFVESMLRDHPNTACMFIICLNTDAEDLAAGVLASLESRDEVEVLEMGELPARYHERLVRTMVPVDEASAVRIAKFGKGRPGEIIQVISDLLAYDELVPAKEGYKLSPKSRLSGEISDIWTLTTDRLEQRGGEEFIVALEIGAALGSEVVLSEWRQVCTMLGADSSEESIELAIQNGAIERMDEGWRFSSPRLAERMKDRSMQAGRWRKIHEVCAHIDFVNVPGHSAHERRSYHLGQAGLDERAQAEMRLAARDLLASSDYARAAALAKVLDDWLAKSAVPRDDPRRVEAMTLRIDGLRFRGRLEEAIEAKQGLEARVSACPDPLTRADAYRCFGNLDYLVVDRARARDWYDAAFDACPDDEHHMIARLHHGLAWFLSNSTELDLARHHYEKAAHHARKCDAQAEVGWALHGIADINSRVIPARDSAVADEAAKIFDEVGSRTGWAAATAVRGDFARLRGELDEAEMLYEDSIDTLVQVGSILEAMARGKLAVLAFVRGQNERALDEARRASTRLEAAMKLPIRAFPEMLMAVLEPRTDMAVAHYELGCELRDTSQYVHPDLDMLAREAEKRFGTTGA